MTRDVRIAVYGEMSLNVIDGSSVWLQSVVAALANQPRNRVTLLLRAGEQRDLLTAPLRSLSGVTLVNPVDEGRLPGPEITRDQALDLLEELDAAERFDAFIMRGVKLCHAAATRKSRAMVGRLWAYLTDVPQRPAELTATAIERLQEIAAASRFLLCQTEALRCYLESWVPGVAGKAILLEPMIPDEVPARAPAPAPLADGEPLRLVYVGKYAPLWNTLEMTRATAELRAAGTPVELHMVGDKIHRPRADPGWSERMEQALAGTPGVIWHRARSRRETMTMLASYHLAVGWRSPALDDSLELSTKLLEYGAVGIPALVNRNSMHEELLGVDYPLFANTAAEYLRAVTAARDPAVRALAAERLTAASRRFAMATVGASLQRHVDRAVPRGDPRGPAPKTDSVDTWMLDRPKVSGACFNLGVVGFVPKRARVDRALSILARVRAVDDRFQLFVKGEPPWDHDWFWRQPDEQAYYREVYLRINGDPLLRGAVHFDGSGADVAAWLRKIGFVLSTSDLESSHLSVAEGMASRALGLMLPGRGADKMFPREWILDDEDQMAAKIITVLESGAWEADGERARAYVVPGTAGS